MGANNHVSEPTAKVYQVGISTVHVLKLVARIEAFPQSIFVRTLPHPTIGIGHNNVTALVDIAAHVGNSACLEIIQKSVAVASQVAAIPTAGDRGVGVPTAPVRLDKTSGPKCE